MGVRIALRNIIRSANLFESELKEIDTEKIFITKTAYIEELSALLDSVARFARDYIEENWNTKFVECSFMQLLGSAPHGKVEVSEHIRITTEENHNGEINFCIASDECDTVFGDIHILALSFRGVTVIILITIKLAFERRIRISGSSSK